LNLVLLRILKTLFSQKEFLKFQCRHYMAPWAEGKVICPDCGKGVVRVWVQLRCKQCQCRRHGVNFLEIIHPKERYCPLCGEQATFLEPLENPKAHQLESAVMQTMTEEEYLQKSGFADWSEVLPEILHVSRLLLLKQPGK
jgi:hypothetical protein